MRFSLKLVMAMAGVVLTAIVIIILVGGPAVRSSYETALHNTLITQMDGLVSASKQRQGLVDKRIQQALRAPRFIDAMNSRDNEVLYQNAQAEFHVALRGMHADSSWMIFGNDFSVRAPDVSSDPLAAQFADAIIPVTKHLAEVTVFYIQVNNQQYEVVLAPVIDEHADERLGSVAVWTPFEAPMPIALKGGGTLETRLEVLPAGTEIDDSAVRDGEYINPARRTITYTRTIVRSPLAQLVSETSLEPVSAAQNALLMRVVIAAGVALLVGLAAALYLSSTLSRPIADMSAAARAIEAGDYSVRVPVRDAGELGALSERFNAMGAGLALRDKYRRVLDAVTDPEVAKELMAGKLDLGGRSQEVGVLFCDIRGFTPLTEHMEPAQVIHLLNEHMSLLTGVAYAHGGVVDKFVGDLIMVTFGAPKPAPDDASRMASCALAMIDARERANTGQAVPIHVGIGCAFGTVVAGCMGSQRRHDYTVLGARVNLAARLCSKAPAMQVYIDDETRMRNPTANCTALEPLDVKGFSRPILAYRLQAVGDGA